MPRRFKFTLTAIAALPAPGKGRTTYYDETVPEFAVRVTSAGSKSFYVVKRDGSKMTWLRLGSSPGMTVELARKAARVELGKFAAGQNPATAKRVEKLKATLGIAFERYMDLHITPHRRGGADIRAIWERTIGTMPEVERRSHGRPRSKHPAGVDWTDRKLDSITHEDVTALHVAIGATQPILANRVVEILSAVFYKAIDWKFTTSNPAAKVTPYKEGKRDRFLQADELPLFFAELAADTSEDFKHFVLLALLTGARRTNVLSARWEHFDLTSAVWHIPEDQSKSGKSMDIPLVPEALAILHGRAPKPAGYVFPADSKSGYITPPKKRWQALLARTGIADLRIHDLRRTMGSWQAITGASLAIIGKSLGHTTASSTMIYARLSMDPVRQAMTTATSSMLEAAGMKKPAEVKPLKRSKSATGR